MSEYAIRPAQPGDAESLLVIYRPLVESTTVSFELTTPTVAEFEKRIEATLKTHEWLVMTSDSGLCGYAYGTTHRPRAAYKYSVETSVYVRVDYQGRGMAKRLYRELFDSLSARGYHNAYAGIALPNAASVALHRAAGFEPIGVFREVGFKFDKWHDVSWWQRKL